MKNTRKMGIASLLLISLFLIQLIPSLGVKVKAEEKDVTVTVKLKDYTAPDKTLPINMKVDPDAIPEEKDFTQSIQDKLLQQEEENLAKENYYVHEFKLDEDEYERLGEDLKNATQAIEPIQATATLKTFENLSVEIVFEGATPAEASITFQMQGNQVTQAIKSDFWGDIKKLNPPVYQKKLKDIEAKDYTITDLTLDGDNQKELEKYVDNKTTKNSTVTAKATLTKNAPLTVSIKFQYPDKSDEVTSLLTLPGKEVTTAKAKDFVDSLKTNQTYLREERGKTDNKYFVSSLTLDQDQGKFLDDYVKDKTKAQTVTMTAALTPLEPIKANVTVMVDGTLKSTFALSIPAADVTKTFGTEVELKDFVGEHKDFKDNITGIPHDYKKDCKWQYSEKALEKVNQYIKDGKKKGVEISIVLSYSKENATTTTTTTKPSTHKPSRRLTSNLNKYGYRMGSLKLDQSSNSPELPDKLDLIVESEPLRRSFASKAEVPVPQGDRLIAQYFNVSTNPSINLSKYGSTLTLNIDERASSSAITIYHRKSPRAPWNRISKRNYEYYRESGELEIKDLDDLGEFVVWINQDAKEPRPLDPRPLQRLPLNPSVQVKPNGMLPQGVAPFKPANPQVQGSLVPQLPQVNPNAQLPVTGEKNYIGIMMGTLILACGALILRKAIK